MQNHTTMKTILANRVKEGVNSWLSTGQQLLGIIFLLLFGVGNVWGAETLHVRGYGGWSDSDANLMTGSSSPWTFTAYWETNGTFKISSTSQEWIGGPGAITVGAAAVNLTAGGGSNMYFNSIPTGGGIYTITVTKVSSTYKIQVTAVSVEQNSWKTITAPKIYWDNTNASYSNVAMLNGRVWNYGSTAKVGSNASKLTHITNTDLWYTTSISFSGDKQNFTTTLFVNGDWNTEETNVATKRAAYASSYTATNTATLNSNTYLFSAANGNKGATLNRSQLASGYSNLNHSQTVYKYTSSGGTTPGSYTAQSVNSGTITITAVKMKSASTANSTDNSATINTAATTSASKDAVYTGEVTLTASPNTGYSFVGWFESTSATTAISSETSYSYNAPNATKSIYARFLAEETHDVTVYYKYGSTTVKTETTETGVGVTTERSFSAPDVDGYNFYSYTFGSGLTMKSASTNTNPCRFVTKASGDYELTTNYNIAPVKMYYGNTSTFANSSYSSMTYDATKKAYYVDVTTNSKPYYFRFDFNTDTKELAGDWSDAGYPNVNEVTANGSKVACATDVKGWTYKSSLKFDGTNGSSIRIWFSYKDKQAWITEATYTVTITNDGNGTTSPASVTAGKNTLSGSFSATANTGYYFKNWTQTSGSVTITNANVSPTTTKATAASTIQANFNPKWQVLGNGEFGGWTAYGSNLFTGYITEGGKDKGYYSITLSANTTYEIQAYDRQASKLYGGTAVQDVYYNTSGFENPYTLATQSTGKNLYIHTAAGGTYQLEWNLTDKKIAIQYPTSWFITSGQKTEGQDDNAGGSFTAMDGSNDVKGGKFVADGASVTFEATPNTGYNFDGWYTNEACTEGKDATNPKTISSITADKTIYAKFVPNTYTVTLTQTGAASTGTPSVTASYNTTAPAIASLPTAAQGYAFMGYYTAADGEGTQFVQANGTWNDVTSYISGGKWIYDDDVELFAYFKQAEITAITLNSSVLDPVDAGGEGWVIANPTVAPTPVAPTKICWELLYDNDNPVPAGHEAQAYAEVGKPNQVRFSIAGLAASRYKIKATLRTGSSCDGGDELSTHTQTFTIASSFTVNILYQDDDHNNIAPGTTSPGKATDWTTISAPDIFGYSFVGWTLGEGITTEDPTDKQNDFRFKASYYGTIVAQYTKNQYIYLDLSQDFSTYGKWNNPYVYFYNGDPWVDNKGAGARDGGKTHTHYISGHAMTKIDGTDIWYFDYGGVSGATQYVAFTWGDKTMQENFNATDVIFRGDFSESTPLFVPATDGTAVSRKDEVNGAQYYNKGYWVTYLGEPTGYTLLVYNSAGNVQLKSEPFIAADKRMTMTSTVELDASSTYKIEVLRNDGYWYKAASNFTASSLGPKPILPTGTKYGIQTNADGIYTFTLGYNSGNLQLSVVYPSSIGDFRIAYTDNATWSHSHTLGSWILPSKTIVHRANGVDTVSFFISKGAGITPKIRWEKVTAVSESSVTWGTTGEWLTTDYTDVSEAGVYNFKVTQNADGTAIASIERIGEYDGSYYIRCNALRSKWDHYTIDSDHRMTYSEFSESAANSFGEKYSHYKAKWCPRNTNIAFVIANDYSPCLTDKLTQDVGGPAFNNLEADGTLKYEKTGGDMKYNDANAYLDKYSANVRFMWNRKTNKISRAYVSAATSNNAKFLVLQGSGTANSNIYNGTTGSAFTANPPGDNSVILKDDQNWIYEEVIKANPSALVKLYANYCDQTQWFRGADGTPFEKNVNAIELLGGSASSAKYAVRVIYDFKTNRLVCAWMPEGASQEIETNLTVNADVMVIREHQGSAQCITFANDKSMTGVKTVYGAMKFNRWILSNRAHPEDTNPDHCRESNLGADLANFHPVLPIGQQLSIYERSLYFISFPFDVKASEIFGFGRYWDEWYLEYYDGKTRAQKGYWIDSPPNWKYVTPDMLEDFTLKANEGYILGLDLDFMQVDNTAFWSNGISTVELYFPSTVNLETLQQTDVTIPALSSDYKCTINRGTPEGDRRVKDSYWRCLGVPSFNIYNSALKDGSGSTIEWKTDYTWHADEREFPFIYMWNKADNTLTAQSTSAFNFLPMHAYLVQNGGEIKWTAVSAKPSSIVARKENDMPATTYEWRLTLNQDSNMVDQTFVRMTNLEQVTDTFDFGQDMSKEFNKTRSNLYSFINYERAAANCLTLNTESNTIIPLGLNIIAGGDYTLAMPDGTNGVGITLVDEATGTRTNISAGLTYPVTLEKGDYTNRFFLEISPIKTTPTGIEDVQGGNVQSAKVHKVMIDGILYIVKDGKIFDARGARLR